MPFLHTVNSPRPNTSQGPCQYSKHTPHPKPCPLTCLNHDLGQHVGSQGGHLAGLADDGAASSQGGGNLEREQVGWEVPRRDLPGHTHWREAGVASCTDLSVLDRSGKEGRINMALKDILKVTDTCIVGYGVKS